jgi:cysteine synthase A
MTTVTESIGNTPLVVLQRITREVTGRILVKLDYLTPGFSKKDRIARQMIDDAEQSSELAPGQSVVALTSGNTGTGLAIVCRARGYKFVAVMSAGNSPERARMMQALGAEVVLVEQLPESRKGEVSGADLKRVEEESVRIARERNALCIDQFSHQGNFRAHYLGTGPEIWRQCAGRVDAFCDFIGTAGGFAGCAAALKERRPAIKCFAVEPVEAAVLQGREPSTGQHPIQGGGYAMSDLPLLNREHIDGYLAVTGDEARHHARLLAREEGIFAGFSTGANLAAAIQLLAGPMPGATIAIVAGDSGLKYLSTDLWG